MATLSLAPVRHPALGGRSRKPTRHVNANAGRLIRSPPRTIAAAHRPHQDPTPPEQDTDLEAVLWTVAAVLAVIIIPYPESAALRAEIRATTAKLHAFNEANAAYVSKALYLPAEVVDNLDSGEP